MENCLVLVKRPSPLSNSHLNRSSDHLTFKTSFPAPKSIFRLLPHCLDPIQNKTRQHIISGAEISNKFLCICMRALLYTLKEAVRAAQEIPRYVSLAQKKSSQINLHENLHIDLQGGRASGAFWEWNNPRPSHAHTHTSSLPTLRRRRRRIHPWSGSLTWELQRVQRPQLQAATLMSRLPAEGKVHRVGRAPNRQTDTWC